MEAKVCDESGERHPFGQVHSCECGNRFPERGERSPRDDAADVGPVLLGRSGCSLKCALDRWLQMLQRGVPRPIELVGTVKEMPHESTG